MHRSPFPRFAARLVLAAAVLAVLPLGGLGAARRPEWTVAGEHLLDLETGVASVEGRFGYDVGEFNANITLALDGPDGLLAAGTSAGQFPTIYTATGTWGRDEATGRTRVTIVASGFSFEGVMDVAGNSIVGTHSRLPGFGGGSESSSGPLVLGRTPPGGSPDTFALLALLAQNGRGKITGTKVRESGRTKRSKASLRLWNDDLLENGKIKGKLKVDGDGNTTGTLKVRGKGWSVNMAGPVDQDGFHALADIRTPLLDVEDVAITVPVTDVPDLPPPPPPKPPRNQIDLATAFFDGGQLEIFRGGVAKRFFGKKVDLTIRLPSDAGTGFSLADPNTALLPQSTGFSVTDSKDRTWGTATEPGSVNIEVLEWTTVRGETIKLRANGKIAGPSGSTKKVNVIVLARVL